MGDASDEDERAHWERVLKLLEAGPSGSKALVETAQLQPQPQQQQQQQQHHHHHDHHQLPQQQPTQNEQVSHATGCTAAMSIPLGVPDITANRMPPPLAAPLRAAGLETEGPSAEARAPHRMATPSVLEVTGTLPAAEAVPLRPLGTETLLHAPTLQIGAAMAPPPPPHLEAPAAVASAPLSVPVASDDLVSRLRNMGFSDADAAEAAKR